MRHSPTSRRAAPDRVRATTGTLLRQTLDQGLVPIDAGEERVNAQVLVVRVDGPALGGLIRNGANR